MMKGAAMEEVIRGLQRVLDLVDTAKSEAIETDVVLNLDKAHRELCVKITALNAGDSRCGAIRREFDAAQRKPLKNFNSPADHYAQPGRYRRKRQASE